MRQIIVFVLLSGLLCWLMFSPIYRHVVVVRHALLQQEVDYLLEIGASGDYGYISNAMIEQSKQRLSQKGFNPEFLVYEVTTTTGASGMSSLFPVPRGTGIGLHISYPFGNMFLLDQLIGVRGPDPESTMMAYGMQMSEYVAR